MQEIMNLVLSLWMKLMLLVKDVLLLCFTFFFSFPEYHSYRYNNFDVLCFLLPGGRRFSEGTSADREIQRTLMEVCRK